MECRVNSTCFATASASYRFGGCVSIQLRYQGGLYSHQFHSPQITLPCSAAGRRTSTCCCGCGGRRTWTPPRAGLLRRPSSTSTSRPSCRARPDPELHSLVSRYQVHNHTFTCGGLDGGRCRFRYPKQPCEVTRLRQDGDRDLQRGDAYVIARGEGDGKIVPYSPALLRLSGANLDLEFIGSAAGAAAYVTAYLTKAETDGIRETVQEAVASMPEDAPTEQQLRRACMVQQSKREYSMQEAAYLLIGAKLHLRGSSLKFVKLCLKPKQERPGIATRRAFDAASDGDAAVELAANISTTTPPGRWAAQVC